MCSSDLAIAKKKGREKKRKKFQGKWDKCLVVNEGSMVLGYGIQGNEFAPVLVLPRKSEAPVESPGILGESAYRS